MVHDPEDDREGHEWVPGVVHASLEHNLAGLEAQLRQSVVFFATWDRKLSRPRIAGSGVLADVYGTKVVLTAGHVLEHSKDEFNDGLMKLSVNVTRGHLSISPDAVRLQSPGGHLGPDAGVLILPAEQIETYFQLGNFNPGRASTLRPTLPPIGMDCLVAGYPKGLGNVEKERLHSGEQIVLRPTMMLLGAHLLESDAMHHWLHSGDGAIDVETDKERVLRGGDFDGLSGGGFYSFISKPIQTHDGPRMSALLCLHGVHTGSDGHDMKRLRQTPIAHHLRLLARHTDALREKVHRHWPEVDLDGEGVI